MASCPGSRCARRGRPLRVLTRAGRRTRPGSQVSAPRRSISPRVLEVTTRMPALHFAVTRQEPGGRSWLHGGQHSGPSTHQQALHGGQCDRAGGWAARARVTDAVCHTSPDGLLPSYPHLDCGQSLSLRSPAHGRCAVTKCTIQTSLVITLQRRDRSQSSRSVSPPEVLPHRNAIRRDNTVQI